MKNKITSIVIRCSLSKEGPGFKMYLFKGAQVSYIFPYFLYFDCNSYFFIPMCLIIVEILRFLVIHQYKIIFAVETYLSMTNGMLQVTPYHNQIGEIDKLHDVFHS